MTKENASASPRPNPPPYLRWFYRIFGMILVPIGIAGVIFPILPGVPLLIVAAACFARSSPKFEYWIINHRVFGPSIVAWRERGAISLRSKIFAVTMMGVSLLVILLSGTPAFVQIGAVSAITLIALFVVTRPNE